MIINVIFSSSMIITAFFFMDKKMGEHARFPRGIKV
jgi:hypothetical protein